MSLVYYLIKWLNPHPKTRIAPRSEGEPERGEPQPVGARYSGKGPIGGGPSAARRVRTFNRGSRLGSRALPIELSPLAGRGLRSDAPLGKVTSPGANALHGLDRRRYYTT